MIDYNEILLHLYVGTCPYSRVDIGELKDRLGVTAVLNLQTDEDLRERGIHWRAMTKAYRKSGIEPHRVPLRDFDYNHQKEHLPDAVRALDRLLSANHTVYLHCNAGVGRSPLVAMAYLHGCRKMGLEEAIRHVRERRPCSPYEELLEGGPRSCGQEG
jgi:atypical dual specificity phosphatase